MKYLRSFNESFESDIITKLINLCEKWKYENSESIMLENNLIIGECNGSNVYATYIDTINDDEFTGISINIVSKDDDESFDENSVYFLLRDDGSPSFLDDNNQFETSFIHESSSGVQLFSSALEIIYDSIKKSGENWLKYQRDIRQESLNLHRKLINNEKLTWEERIRNQELNGIINNLFLGIGEDNTKEVKRMREMGEEAYNKREKLNLDRMKEFMKSRK